LRHVVPERVARIDGDPRVVSRVDPAQAGLVRYVAVAGIGRHNPWQDVGGCADLILVPEEGGQHGRCVRANHGVGGWIIGIKRSDDERCPGRVADYCRIPGRLGIADGCDGSPQLVVVFGVIESNDAIGEGQVEHREQPRGGFQVRVVPQRGWYLAS